jgi:hypothetical protein
MEDLRDSTEAPPRQSFIEDQLSSAITTPRERDKLNASMDAFFKEIDEGESPPEVEKTPVQPVQAQTPAPIEQPARQIALQPTLPPPDPLDNQARQMEVGAYITRHPSYKQEKLATQAAYLDCIQEMSRFFNAPAEQIKEQFLDPLKNHFTPDQLTAEWFQEQVGLMNCPEVVKRKIETKWAEVMLLQERQDQKARELAANYDADQQQIATQNYTATLRSECENALDDDREFSDLRKIRDRANAGDQKAKAEFDKLEREVFVPYLVKLLTDKPTTPVGAAARKALRHVTNHLQSKGKKTMASPASQSSHSPSPSSQKPLPKNSRDSLAEAFDQWTPPAKEDSCWDAATNSYKRRAR